MARASSSATRSSTSAEHGRDLKRYVRDLEEAIIRTVAPHGLEAARLDGLTGVWVPDTRGRPAEARLDRRPRDAVGDDARLRAERRPRPAPFTDWITACGLEDASFTTIAHELGRAVTVDQVRPTAVASLAEVFGLAFEELPAEDGMGLWAQPVHEKLAAR